MMRYPNVTFAIPITAQWCHLGGGGLPHRGGAIGLPRFVRGAGLGVGWDRGMVLG